MFKIKYLALLICLIVGVFPSYSQHKDYELTISPEAIQNRDNVIRLAVTFTNHSKKTVKIQNPNILEKTGFKVGNWDLVLENHGTRYYPRDFFSIINIDTKLIDIKLKKGKKHTFDILLNADNLRKADEKTPQGLPFVRNDQGTVSLFSIFMVAEVSGSKKERVISNKISVFL